MVAHKLPPGRVYEPFEENEPNPIQNDKIIQLLSDKWSIDEGTIELQIEGRDKEQS